MTMTGDPILGNIATFKCNAAYQLVGSQKRVCAANGKWSGAQPTCNGKTNHASYAYIKRLNAEDHMPHG